MMESTDVLDPGMGTAGSKIFVGGLDRSVDEGVVRNFFSQFGPVVEVLVMRDPHNHQSRGFGFITFQREDSAGIVLQNRYHDMLGKRVEVKSAVPRGQAPPPQRGPPRSSQGYGYGNPRGGHPGGPGAGYGYGGNGYGAPNGGFGNDGNPWGNSQGGQFGNPGQGQGPQGVRGPGGYGMDSKPMGVAPGGDDMGGGGDKSGGWTEHTAPEGYVYYYNARSGVSQWERPMELDFPMSQN